MAKKTKKAAPVKAEATRSRTAAPAEQREFTIEKLGTLIRWTLPTAPYQTDKNLRMAFVAGFEMRVSQVNMNQGQTVPERFNAGTPLQQAFEDGYAEAARQDGTDLKPRTLTGSSSPKAKSRR